MGNSPKVKAGTEPAPIFALEFPLARIQGESMRSNSALHDLAFMGSARSLRKLHRLYLERDEKRRQNVGKAWAGNGPVEIYQEPPTLRLPTLEAWSARFLWQERLDAFDALLHAEHERKWAERVDALREREWKIGNGFLDLVESGLAEGPKFVRTHRRIVKATGQEIVTLQHDLVGINASAKTGDQMLRLAAGMETERQQHEHSGPGGGPIQLTPGLDLSGLDDAQLRDSVKKLANIALAYANGESLAAGDVVSQPGERAASEHPVGEGAEPTDA